MTTKSTPAGWEPPSPAWQTIWDSDVAFLVAGYFGIQSPRPEPLSLWAEAAFSRAHGPASIEQGTFVDKKGVLNHLYIAYWKGTDYEKWWAIDQNRLWWDSSDRLQEDTGYWREIIHIPLDHLETLHSTDIPHGIGTLGSGIEGPLVEHGYSGAMRDRIPLYDHEDLKETCNIHTGLTAQVSENGQRVLIHPARNMCVIRSGQNWSFCDEEQKAYYLKKVQPVLAKGMQFLQEHPDETSCYSMRYVRKTDRNWNAMAESFGLGYATDVYAFENWAKSHPTHVRIFDQFMQMVELFGEGLALRLWHEVSVLPAQGCEFTYIGCHSDTGLLGYI